MKPSILVVLKAVAQTYCAQSSAPRDFFMEMLVLALPQCCPMLLSGEDDELLVNLKEFLIDYLRKVRAGLQGQLQQVLVSSSRCLIEVKLDLYPCLLI